MPLEGKRVDEWLYELSMRPGHSLQPLSNGKLKLNHARKPLRLTGDLIIEHHYNYK